MQRRLFFILAALTTGCTGTVSGDASDPVGTQQEALFDGSRTTLETSYFNKVNTYWSSFNSRDIPAFTATLNADSHYTSPNTRDYPLNRAGLLAYQAAYFATFPDLHETTLRQFVEGNTVVTYYKLAGTFTHELYPGPGLPPIPPNGVFAEASLIEVFTFDNATHKIAQQEDINDITSYLAAIQVQLQAPNFAYPPTLSATHPGLIAPLLRTNQEKDNLEAVQSVLEAVNARNYAALPAALTQDFSYVTPLSPLPLDAGGFAGYAANLGAAFPDRQYVVRSAVVEKDDVAIQYIAAGAHYGTLQTPLGPLPATGRMTSVRGTLVVKLQNGKVKELIDLWDTANLFSQLGL